MIELDNYVIRYNAACTYAVMGEAEAALECLEYIYSQVPRARRWLLGLAEHDTQLESIRPMEAYTSLIGRLRMVVGP